MTQIETVTQIATLTRNKPEARVVATQRSKRLRESRVAAGLCPRCGKANESERKNCATCRQALSDYKMARYSLAVLRGLCVICEQEPAGRFVACGSCRRDRQVKNSKREMR